MKRLIGISIIAFSLLFLLPFNAVGVSAETVGIIEGEEYYLKNLQSGLYLDANTSNDNVRVASFTGANNQKWRFKYKSNGTYVLIPVHKTSYRLDVFSANNAQNANVDIYPYTNGSDQEWQVTRNTNNGTYHLRSGCSSFTKYLSAVGTTSGSNVVQSTQYDTNYRLWGLEKVDKGLAYLFPMKINGNVDCTGANADFLNYGSKMGYAAYQYTNSTASYAYDRMFGDIWVFAGHGRPGAVHFNSASYADNGAIVATAALRWNLSLDKVVSSMYEIPGNRCTLLLGCETGVSSGTTNSVDYIFNKGAQFVAGTTGIRYDGDITSWLQVFIKSSYNKQTITKALEEANAAVSACSKWYIKGDTHQRLNR